MASPLSILHFSTVDNIGGSGRSAYRIHTGLRDLGHQSRMLVGQKVTSDSDVETVHGSIVGRVSNYAADVVTTRLGLQYLFLPSSHRIRGHRWVEEADVIQVYNTHGGYFSHRLLPSLSRMRPIVWRLSDMWPMTGHCAYSGDCDRWKIGCGKCPDLAGYPPLPVDTTSLLWNIKNRLYARSNITLVAPSSWIEDMVRQSPLLQRFDVRRIPNGLDLSVFRPMERSVARDILDIDPRQKVILFAAHGVDDNPRKGSLDLIEALKRLPSSRDHMLLLCGEGGEEWHRKVDMPVKVLGYVADDRMMALVYSSADVIVLPSIVENLPNSVLEAMACGIPAVAYDTGGMKDAVRHMDTGYLARYRDVQDLANGITYLLNDDQLRTRLSTASRALIERQFGATQQANRFVDLYTEILQRETLGARKQAPSL